MARYRRGQASTVVATLWSLLISWTSLSAWAADTFATTLLYERPVLTIDPGMHTAQIRSAAVDRAGRLAVTGSHDKTVRIWSLADGKLLQTIRVPAGPGNVGKIHAVAMSPDGKLIAAGGWTTDTIETVTSLYLFDQSKGIMAKRIAGLTEIITSLVFSADGRYLATGLGGGSGLRVYDREEQWAEVLRDEDYETSINSIKFTEDGRLATASDDGVQLYDSSFRLIAQKMTRGNHPQGLDFNPGGTVLAVCDGEYPIVDLLDAQTL